ncbi:protein CLEC16A-like isoform X3 [Artemia franciscana]|uniref:protein CLEC16A-like isoform X3 n=1 Tax=Artemia franciscana TaxID=6661 RepID=UPI0032DBBA6E
MQRAKTWISGNLSKGKNFHSLDHLKYLHNVLVKNQTVSDSNRSLLVETLRQIAEILIWGDQNDSTVFDFFLEKNMLSYFLRILNQRCGSYVCVQLLQTLNILFENMRNETSLYYLLSNNHVNSIIVHKFDFSDEEVMAYYISFLKTLSLKLNPHTIHFFYNEQTKDFPLYTEAIKFFNHSESMVRIAVRTLTLNVYRVGDMNMLRFIRDKTAAPYFSNLVWFIGNHIMELNNCVRSDSDRRSRDRLSDFVAEHLDHLHYLNDIMCLSIDLLNDVLVEHLLNTLFIPLYVNSLAEKLVYEPSRPHVSRIVALFLLTQVFVILKHRPLVRTLAWFILNGKADDTSDDYFEKFRSLQSENIDESEGDSEIETGVEPSVMTMSSNGHPGFEVNITDEEKEMIKETHQLSLDEGQFGLMDRPFLKSIFDCLDVNDTDYVALFALCLLYSMSTNEGIDAELLDEVGLTNGRSSTKSIYNRLVAHKLADILLLSAQQSSRVRPITVELACLHMRELVCSPNGSHLDPDILTKLEHAKDDNILVLRNFYKGEEMFLDLFEAECADMKRKPLNISYLTMDASVLLPPIGTPMSGVEFPKRLPCGDVERARRTVRVFLSLRSLHLAVKNDIETVLPLASPQTGIKEGEILDLNNSDLIGCTIISKDGQRHRRFLVVDLNQIILVEPDTRRLGWGVAKFVGWLQDVEVTGDKEDSRYLHVTVQRQPAAGTSSRSPLLSARFLFDDHIRCMAAKQRLTKGRLRARQRKMQQIAKLLDLSGLSGGISPASSLFLRQDSFPRRGKSSQQQTCCTHRTVQRQGVSIYGPMFVPTKVPGFPAAFKPEERRSSSTRSGSRSHSAHPPLLRAVAGPSFLPRSSLSRPGSSMGEDIPLADLSGTSYQSDENLDQQPGRSGQVFDI